MRGYRKICALKEIKANVCARNITDKKKMYPGRLVGPLQYQQNSNSSNLFSGRSVIFVEACRGRGANIAVSWAYADYSLS